MSNQIINKLFYCQQIAEPQTHLYLPHRLVVDITIDGPTTTTTTTRLSRAIAI